jgi:uncharacterized membrane protein YbhN (UPF0104 family)
VTRSPDAEVELAELVTRSVKRPVATTFAAYAPTRAFAVPRDARRVRRPTDVTLLLVTLGVLLWTGSRVDEPSTGLQAAVTDVLRNVPGFLHPICQVLHDLLLVWALLIVVLTCARRHWSLLRDIAVALPGTWLAAAVVGRLATGHWPDLVSGALHESRPIDFPSLTLAGAVAVVSVASPHLARPFRYAGRWFVVLGAASFTVLQLGELGQALGSVALGWAVAAAVHLVVGSPGGLPSLERVRLGLAGMGIDAETLDVERRSGVAVVRALGADGTELDVKVYGRDAWDGQLLVSLWRFLWYRDAGPMLSLTRLQQVEHEAFLTLLAERRGVPVTRIVAAGLDVGHDALLVTERFGNGLGEAEVSTDDQLSSAWAALERLHAAGISHGALDREHIRVRDGDVRLSNFAGARAAPDSDEQLVDEAQLLMATAVVVGVERAVAAAHDALGVDGLAALSSFVQPAALSPSLRREVDRAEFDVDDIRAAVVDTTAQPPRDLQQLRRLSLASVLVAVLLLVASWALVSSIADIGLDTIMDAIQAASGPLLILAFLLGLTPRVANAVALSAAAPSRIPLGRLTALQFAITFVNLAMPSTAARAAVTIRFFQRSGVEPTAAVSIGVLDSVTGFVGQILVIVTILGFGLGTLDLDIAGNVSDELVGLLVLLAAALVVALVVVAVVSRFRNAVLGALRRASSSIGPVLTSPGRLMKLLGANIAAELLFALCMYTVLRAFGQDVGYADVVLVNECVALFAGLMPVPGGIGVTEAALTAGFIAIGVDEATAFAAAITYRVVTYYTPPVIGFGALRWLQRQRFL